MHCVTACLLCGLFFFWFYLVCDITASPPPILKPQIEIFLYPFVSVFRDGSFGNTDADLVVWLQLVIAVSLLFRFLLL